MGHRALVDRLVATLVTVALDYHADLTVTDLGDLAMALVDAATVVIGSPSYWVVRIRMLPMLPV